MHDQELVLEEERLRNYGTGAARSEQAGQGSDEVDEKNDQIAHHRIVAGRGILRNLGRNNNSPVTRSRLGAEKQVMERVAPQNRPSLEKSKRIVNFAMYSLTDTAKHVGFLAGVPRHFL